MDLRLRALQQLDARAVTLPHGMEVVTRVDRVVGERRVPQGSVGRVTKVSDESLANTELVALEATATHPSSGRGPIGQRYDRPVSIRRSDSQSCGVTTIGVYDLT